jgi:predicted small secreted protein
MVTTPTQYRVLRFHPKPFSIWKGYYEEYDADAHAIHISWAWPGNVSDTVYLHPEESVKDYLRATEGSWFYEEPTDEDIQERQEQFYRHWITPMKHVCDPDFECTDPDCLLCDDEFAQKVLVNHKDGE